jgi:hypothetical protein
VLTNVNVYIISFTTITTIVSTFVINITVSWFSKKIAYLDEEICTFPKYVTLDIMVIVVIGFMIIIIIVVVVVVFVGDTR